MFISIANAAEPMQFRNIISAALSSGPMVMFILLLLLFFSVVSWGIMIIKFIQVKRARHNSHEFLNTFWRSPDLLHVYNHCKRLGPSPIMGVFRTAFVEMHKTTTQYQDPQPIKTNDPALEHQNIALRPIDNISRAVKASTDAELASMERNLPFLATTGSVTPFVGLFGTVWGILNAFSRIGLMGSANLAVVAPGIAEALVATAAGLGAAIPAVIGYNYFLNQIRTITIEIENFSSDLMKIIERRYN
jgi:biopolymer transport protein TolQ